MVNHMFFEREEAKTLLGKYQFQQSGWKADTGRFAKYKG